jgi:hypothetical protein
LLFFEAYFSRTYSSPLCCPNVREVARKEECAAVVACATCTQDVSAAMASRDLLVNSESVHLGRRGALLTGFEGRMTMSFVEFMGMLCAPQEEFATDPQAGVIVSMGLRVQHVNA